MGAKGQVFTGNLTSGNAGDTKSRGQIIVRAESVQESNLAAKFQMRWSNINNESSGCMGMCPEI